MDVDGFGRAKFMDGVSRSALGPLDALLLLHKDPVPNPNAVEIASRALVTTHPDGDAWHPKDKTSVGVRGTHLMDLCLLVGVRGSPSTRSRSAT